MSLGPPPAWRRTFPQGYGWRGACMYELAIVREETALRGDRRPHRPAGL